MISSILAIISIICLYKGFLKYCDKHDINCGSVDNSDEYIINQAVFFDMMNNKE